MPELSKLVSWQSVNWDNMDLRSGTGDLERKPYYFRLLGAGKKGEILLISAVPSRTQSGSLHATDYLRLDHDAFARLMEIGKQAFDTLSKK